MGHDIVIRNILTGETIGYTYITGNFSKYDKTYPGICSIHGHSIITIIKIIKKTLKKMLDDDIVPYVHNPATRALTFGDSDPQKDLECYAACLQEFLIAAIDIKNKYDEDARRIYWYSDQVFETKKFCDDDGYESDGSSEKY